MKKKLLKILLPVFVLSSISTVSIYASNNNLKFNESELTISQNNIQARWSWSGSVYLDNNNYCNITTYNNFWRDSPKVTNDASNKNSITVRAINESGEVVASAVTVKPGQTVKLDQIKALEGKITFQAKGINGYYRISLT